jgi:predicted esterase
MTTQRIIANPGEWIITKRGDFVRIKDSEIHVEKKLEAIRKHLTIPYKGVVRFQGKTPEQISKERYDKVLEEINFDYEKLHDWIYDERNKDKVEIIKLDGQDFSEAAESIFNHIKNSRQKWREILDKKVDWNLQNWYTLINEETGQVIYPSAYVDKEYSKLHDANRKLGHNKGIPTKRTSILIDWADERGNVNKVGNNRYNSVVIFLHGTYGAIRNFREIEKNFPNTKFIYPYSPVLQYDMWHGSERAPGSQEKGWINITGDAHEVMDTDVCPNNPPPKKNFEEADRIIHLDYPQLMRAVSYVNEIIKEEIEAGIPPEKIIIGGYSQGALLTLAAALTSQHKLGGFVSLCGFLPRWDKLLVRPSEKNKNTPCLIVNNSGDPWVPFWTGKKTYDLLKERDWNVEFKTYPGLGHSWKNEKVKEFLGKCFNQEIKKRPDKIDSEWSTTQKIAVAGGIIGVVIVICLIILRKKKKR